MKRNLKQSKAVAVAKTQDSTSLLTYIFGALIIATLAMVPTVFADGVDEVVEPEVVGLSDLAPVQGGLAENQQPISDLFANIDSLDGLKSAFQTTGLRLMLDTLVFGEDSSQAFKDTTKGMMVGAVRLAFKQLNGNHVSKLDGLDATVLQIIQLEYAKSMGTDPLQFLQNKRNVKRLYNNILGAVYDRYDDDLDITERALFHSSLVKVGKILVNVTAKSAKLTAGVQTCMDGLLDKLFGCCKSVEEEPFTLEVAGNGEVVIKKTEA